jgi:hypothetical protein
LREKDAAATFLVRGIPMLVAILASMTLSALVLMLAFPRTPTGKWLHRILVEAPARFFADLTWTKLGQLSISLAVVIFLAAAGPEGIALLTAAGVDAAMLELILALWLASVSGSIVGAWRTATRFVANLVKQARASIAPRNRARRPRCRKHRPQSKNDDPEPGLAFA